MNIDPNTLELNEQVIHIGRVSKTVKGGRNMRFTALVIVGNGKASSAKVWVKRRKFEAIRKGIENAKRI